MTTSEQLPQSGMNDDVQSLGTVFVTRLLDRHQVPSRQRATSLEKALGMSYQQVRRRLANVSDWTIEELQKVAEHFGETLAKLVADDSAASPSPDEPRLPVGVLVLGDQRIPCEVVASDSPARARPTPFVAVRPTPTFQNLPEGVEWIVFPADDASTQDAQAVEKLVLVAPPAPKKRVAVLDDDRDLATTIADYMEEHGHESTAFHTIPALLAAIHEQQFDGYVIDWLVNGHSSASLIREIRQSDQLCPVVVLTGQMNGGQVGEEELGEASQQFLFSYFEKPTRNSLLRTALERSWKTQAPA